MKKKNAIFKEKKRDTIAEGKDEHPSEIGDKNKKKEEEKRILVIYGSLPLSSGLDFSPSPSDSESVVEEVG